MDTCDTVASKTEVATIPSTATGALARLKEATAAGIEPALAIMLDEALFNQVKRIADIMSKARGFVPSHCVDAPQVCFAVASRALVWRLDPFAVAQATYQPAPGAKVAYEAKLVQAILEQSGRLAGAPQRRYLGDWSGIQGKHVMRPSKKDPDKEYAARGWSDKDEEGLGIVVSARVKGETEPREVELMLRQCHPRNSTLWATDPKTQIYYRAIRMLGNVAMPSVLMGVPFIGDEDPDDPAERAARARVVNPERAQAPLELVDIVDAYGQTFSLLPAQVEQRLSEWASVATDEELSALLENNPEHQHIIELVDMERAAAKPRPEPAKEQPEAVMHDPRDPLGIRDAEIMDQLRALETAVKGAGSYREAMAILDPYRDAIEPKRPKGWSYLLGLADKADHRG